METTMEGVRNKVVGTRITENLEKVIGEYLKRDAHLNVADFIRDAIREKLKRDTPDLYDAMLAPPELQI